MSVSNVKITGGCSCEKVRYELSKEPMFIHCCHCHLCQQQTGSAFITHAFIENTNFNLLSGELTNYEGPSGSGGEHRVKACNNCCTAIVSYFGSTNHLAIVKVGTFDNPNSTPPNAHIFVESTMDWIKIPEGSKCYNKFYEFKKAWPPLSYGRLKNVRKLQNA